MNMTDQPEPMWGFGPCANYMHLWKPVRGNGWVATCDLRLGAYKLRYPVNGGRADKCPVCEKMVKEGKV